MATWYHGAMVTWYHGVEMRTISARMLRGRFWLENQDFGVSFGAICIIFRATSFPTSPRSQNRLFRKIAPGVQGRRNGRGQKLFKLLGRKNCSNFWGPNPSKLSTNVARPILAPESRFWGIRWGNLHHFSRSIRSAWGQFGVMLGLATSPPWAAVAPPATGLRTRQPCAALCGPWARKVFDRKVFR